MTNLEVMEKAIQYTTDIYTEVYYNTKVQKGLITYDGLINYAIAYSAECLKKTILSEDGICTDYPQRENIRENMALIGKEGMVNELLKNIVSVVTYQRLKGILLSLESSFNKNMSAEEQTVILFNNLDYFGPEKAYKLLENPDILYSACLAFVKYRGKEFKGKMDYVSQVDPVAKYLNAKLQEYYESLEKQKVKSIKPKSQSLKTVEN